MDRQARRERILDVALQSFAQHGIAATSTRQIAEASAVSVGAVFYHFETKEDLLEAVIARASVAADLRRIVEQEDRPVHDRMVSAATEFLATLRKRGDLLSVVVQAALVDVRHRDQLAMTLRSETDILAGMLDRSPGATASTKASRALVTALLSGLVTTALLHPQPDPDDDELLRLSIDTLLAGAAQLAKGQASRSAVDV